MEIEVLRFQITIDYTGYPDMVAPRYIVCYLEDSDNSIVVKIRDGSDNYVSTPTSGPGLFLGSNGTADRLTPAPFYQFCESTTLRKIGQINTFPYCQLSSYPNDVACQLVPVCDLEISNTYTTTPSSGPAIADGAVTVSGTSSNGVIKYSLNETFDYATEGNTTGIFTGLIAGTYSVYAKDEVGCFDTIYITIPVTTVYNIRHRAEYNPINEFGFDTRIDIVQRGYAGDMDEICLSGPSPFILNYQESDKYTPFIGSHCVLTLLEETEEQFSHLYTNDPKEFQIKYYKDFGAGFVLVWMGYIVPAFYKRPFVRATNNFVEITASDQIGELKQLDFLDSNENVFRGDTIQLTAILEILQKTDIDLNVRSADDLFETRMDATSADDPLAQTYFDPRIFYPKDVTRKCNDVLGKLIQCKSGLRLFQSAGYWWLVRSEMNVGTFAYREFTIDGTYVTNSTYAAVLNRIIPSSTGGIVWRDASQAEQQDENYGFFSMIHELAFDDNLIDEGDFEERDVIDLGSGNKGFKNWNVFAAQTGLRYGLELIDNKESKGAFFADFDYVTATQSDNQLYSMDIPFENLPSGVGLAKIKFKFEYNVVPKYIVPWIRIGWKVTATGSGGNVAWLKINAGFGPQWVGTEHINEVYVEKSQYNKFSSIELTADAPSDGTAINITFLFHNHIGRDFASLAALVTGNTTDVDTGKRVLVKDGDLVRFYELEDSDDATSSPDTLRPSDWVSSGSPSPNAKVWRLKGSYQLFNYGLVDKILIDNVKFTYLPWNVLTFRNYSPPLQAYYELETSEFIKRDYEETFELGDLPDMPNAINLYRGFLKLADGVPTETWYRSGIVEEVKLLGIALNDRAAQLANAVERIEANLFCKEVFYHFVNSLAYDGGRYLNTKYSLDDKQNNVAVMLDKMTTGADGEPPANFGEYSDAEYDNAEYNVS